ARVCATGRNRGFLIVSEIRRRLPIRGYAIGASNEAIRDAVMMPCLMHDVDAAHHPLMLISQALLNATDNGKATRRPSGEGPRYRALSASNNVDTCPSRPTYDICSPELVVDVTRLHAGGEVTSRGDRNSCSRRPVGQFRGSSSLPFW